MVNAAPNAKASAAAVVFCVMVKLVMVNLLYVRKDCPGGGTNFIGNARTLKI